MSQSEGQRIKQAHLYDLDGVKVLAIESSSQTTVKVCEIVENTPGVQTLGPVKKVHWARLKPLGMRYHKGELP